MFIKKYSQGFTLIEVLVVITIIGTLATITIGALSEGRQKGRDAAIKQTISQIPAQSELQYALDGNYDQVCENLTEITNSLNDLSTTVNCSDNNRGWALEALLNSQNLYFCRDYQGNAFTSQVSTISQGSDYVCGPETEGNSND